MQVTVQGTVKADGTLELAGLPALPAGPVEVVIRPIGSGVHTDDWWAYLQRARAELESSGRRFRTQAEIDSEIDDLRSDERIAAL